MNELFGIPMTGIAIGCLVITLLIFGLVGVIAIRNPVMFKMGLRNIPRRPAQTTLIVVGLMLSTLIITAAFGTGDTLTRSITADVFRQLGEADEIIHWDQENNPAPANQQIIPAEFVEELRASFAGDPDIEAFVPFLREPMPLINERTRLNEPGAMVTAYRPEDAAVFGGLADLDGNPVNLEGNQIAVNEHMADSMEAEVGDTLIGFFQDQPLQLEVAAIVPTNVLGGVVVMGAGSQEMGGAVSLDFLAELTGRDGVFDGVYVSNTGDERTGLERTDVVMERLEAFLEGTPFHVVAVKQDLVELAEMLGNLFTTFFVVLGLFSIAAGVLLIFLIFIMLAAERKPEMGMARAVGAKRRQIVESFLAEGMGYDLGSAVVGLVAGLGVTVIMVAVVNAFGAEALGFHISPSFTWRGLVTAFSLGIIATFIVISVASWRASRLNIVAAIRDLPESKAINPEEATAFGLLRAVLNGFGAIGFIVFSFFGLLRLPDFAPLFTLALLIALIGPFVFLARGTNLGAPKDERVIGERIPLWPFFTILPIPFYLAALLLVRVTRDRKPRTMPPWLVALGILILPLGLVLIALQDRRVPVAWSVGLGTVGLFAGIILIEWGLDVGQYFQFTVGFTLVVVWVAVLMRYFHIRERLAFTISGLVLLAFWYMPAEAFEWLLPEMQGDIEMFFVSGVAVITAATFVVVYNADIVLPIIPRLGSRFGRILPAIKTGIAYPLTSRFRTGMTMAMIGLIMFALVMNAALNRNFANVFLSDDAKAGFDVQVITNPNNPLTDIEGAITEAGLDMDGVRGAGSMLVAFPFEAEVSNPDGYGPPGPDGQPPDYLRFTFLGMDEGFLEAAEIPLRRRASGFESDEAVWEAFQSEQNLAIIPAGITATPAGFGGPPVPDERLRLDPIGDDFEPFTLNLRDPESGELQTVTIIAQAQDAVGTFFFNGIFLRYEDLERAYPSAEHERFYIALEEGVDSRAFARELEASLLIASVDSLNRILDEQRSLQSAFLFVFQGFMGLGLIVGIAALGVVAFRSVIERRQQIGMLRAIGYKRGIVALSFVFESTFIALSGIVMGLVLGLVLAWLLFTTGEIGEEAEGFDFVVPWAQVGIMAGIAFTASLLMTFLPARAASRVPVAEALRYE